MSPRPWPATARCAPAAAEAGGDGRAAARDGGDAAIRPVQPRPPDLCRAEARRRGAAVRAAVKPERDRLRIAHARGRLAVLLSHVSSSPGGIEPWREINEKLLDERLAALESAKTWSPRVVSKLESHIRSADDAGLFRINPMTFSAEKGIARGRDDRSLPACVGSRAVRDELDSALSGLLMRHRKLPGAEEPREPLPLHELQHGLRRVAR